MDKIHIRDLESFTATTVFIRKKPFWDRNSSLM